jgi:hypothetical protein
MRILARLKCSSSVVLLLSILSSLILMPIVAPGEECGSADRLAVALRFAEAVIPELKNQEVDISISEGMGSFFSDASEADGFHLRFDKPTWRPPGETNQVPSAALTEAMGKAGLAMPFELYFDFIEMRPPLYPRRLACHPVVFRSEALPPLMRKLHETVDPHPEWSDAQELDQARKLGLRYGPEKKEAVLRLIPLKELEQFYGKLRVKSAEFSINAGGKCDGCSFVYARWDISLSAAGTSRGLSVVVEPFLGRITSLSSSE